MNPMFWLLPSLFVSQAMATEGYDPSAPKKTFTGQETYTQDGSAKLWSAVERHDDPDTRLFGPIEYNTLTAWPAEADYAPWIADLFGTTEPDSSTFLLHIGANEATATGTPILFVHGAGDNGSRGFAGLSIHMDTRGRPVYALTFPNAQQDMFQQAEIVADAIARVKERTGAKKVDLVGHSKGGIAVGIYISNAKGAEWGDTVYGDVGTVYRDDVRKVVLMGTPLGGIDTGFRWPSANLLSLDPENALAPTSWSEYYAYGTAYYWLVEDLSAQDFFPADGDLFPGQDQLLARHDEYPLPGSLPWLGSYALQIDWYTTYEGGFGYYTYSDGIDAAIESGDHLISRLAANGADPEIQIYLLGGENPLMPNGTEDFLALMFGEAFVDMATASSDQWAAFYASLVGDGMVSVGITEEEVQGLAQGKLMIGEVTGPSDGLVFTTSALNEDALNARGAVIVEARTANLSHLDLLYASPVTAALLEAEAAADPIEDGWKLALARRYAEEDTIGWVREALADEATEPVDTGGPDDSGGGDDTGVPDTAQPEETGDDDSGAEEDSDPTEDSGEDDSGKACSTGGGADAGAGAALGLMFAAAALVTRRKRPTA